MPALWIIYCFLREIRFFFGDKKRQSLSSIREKLIPFRPMKLLFMRSHKGVKVAIPSQKAPMTGKMPWLW